MLINDINQAVTATITDVMIEHGISESKAMTFMTQIRFLHLPTLFGRKLSNQVLHKLLSTLETNQQESSPSSVVLNQLIYRTLVKVYAIDPDHRILSFMLKTVFNFDTLSKTEYHSEINWKLSEELNLTCYGIGEPISTNRNNCLDDIPNWIKFILLVQQLSALEVQTIYQSLTEAYLAMSE